MSLVLLITAIRLGFSVTILRYPLIGGIICILLDYFDYMIFESYGLLGVFNYQLWDKVIDLSYLSLELYILLKFNQRWVRNVAIGLFAYRLIGMLFFELTEQRIFLVLFPNFFENFFLVYLIYLQLKKIPLVLPSITRVVFRSGLALSFIYKIYQELSIHIIHRSPWIGSELLGIH